MGRKRKLINREVDKSAAKKCPICDDKDIDVLEYHRIVPGKDGGTYIPYNVVICCSSCHTLIHKDRIQIKGWFESTGGKVLIIIKDGKEKIIQSFL